MGVAGRALRRRALVAPSPRDLRRPGHFVLMRRGLGFALMAGTRDAPITVRV